MRRRQAIYLVFVSVALLPGQVSSIGPADTAVANICDIKKIHVGAISGAAQSERYRHFMDRYLPEFGIPVVSSPAEADAILSGSLSTREQKIQGDIWLKTSTGVKLWSTEIKTSTDEAAVKKQAKKTARRTAKHIRKQCKARRGGRVTIGVQVGL